MWAEEAITTIWSHEPSWGSPPFPSLLAMPNYRSQKYANSIRHVDDIIFGVMESKSAFYHSQFASVEFPRLETAALEIPKNADEEYRLQYLLPSLRVLKAGEHYQGHGELTYGDYGEFEYTSQTFLAANQQIVQSSRNSRSKDHKSRHRQMRS
jgi:hypothetical protein